MEVEGAGLLESAAGSEGVTSGSSASVLGYVSSNGSSEVDSAGISLRSSFFTGRDSESFDGLLERSLTVESEL